MSLRALCLALATALLTACGDDGAGPDPSSREVGSVEITPADGALRYPGEETSVSAVARNAAGTALDDAPLTWSVADPSVASVEGVGGTATVTAEAFGSTSLTVTAENGVSERAVFRVTGATSLAFLETTWTVSGTAQSLDGGMEEVAGVSRVESYPGDRVLVETLRLTDPEDEVRSLSLLHAPVGNGEAWVTVRVDGGLGTFAVTTGSFEPGTATFTTGDRLGGEDVERAVLDQQTAQGFRLRVEGSGDGGDSWAPVLDLTYVRDPGAELPQASSVPSPACDGPPHNAFDYWLGTWDVENPTGTAVGSNEVERVADGCAIRENWRGVDRSIGVSLNGYDARSGAWTQVYLDSAGGTLELVGGIEQGVMTLRGNRGGLNDRIRWIPQADGVVRQLWETRTASGDWQVFFDGRYIPED